MKKLKTTATAFVFTLLSAIPVYSIAAQPVTDIDSLNELKQIRALLEKNTTKSYTCTDGDKYYTAGMDVTRNGAQYKCEVKGDHAEWVFIPRMG